MGEFHAKNSDSYYIGVYLAISMWYFFCMVGSLAMMIFITNIASLQMHNRMLHAVVYSPMSWFHSFANGKIGNRFSSDIGEIDWMADSFWWLAVNVFWLFSSIALVASSAPIFVALIVPVAAVYVFIGWFYRFTERAVKRIASAKMSPVYSLMGEAIDGAQLIRTFRREQMYEEECEKRSLARLRATFYQKSVSCSGNTWMEMLGAFIAGGGVFIVFWSVSHGTTATTMGALALSFVLDIQGTIQQCVQQFNEVEIRMVSTERIFKWARRTDDDKLEFDMNLDGTSPGKWAFDSDWKPPDGAVTLRNLKLRYTEDGQDKLGGHCRKSNPNSVNYDDTCDGETKCERAGMVGKDGICKDHPGSGFTLSVRNGERVAIVGPSGAGKSSLTNALFRFVQPHAGGLELGGIDVRNMRNPAQFRRHLSIVSQEPLLFNQGVCDNLDPYDRYTEAEMESVLRQVGLWEKVDGMGGLARVDGAIVAPDGANFSVGQRQLLSLARAVLRKCSVLVLDEATASCDVESDQMIQDTVGRLCKQNGTTVITIAHRLSTIMDYDRVAVLDNGNIVECGNPHVLLDNPRSWFATLAQAGDVVDADNASSPVLLSRTPTGGPLRQRSINFDPFVEGAAAAADADCSSDPENEEEDPKTK